MSQFYEFHQNTSGGSFDIVPDQGISIKVIIESEEAGDANAKAEALGLYFDGCSDGRDCGCCGDRWYKVSERDVTDEPDTTPASAMPFAIKWNMNGPEGFVHYLDGRVEGFDY